VTTALRFGKAKPQPDGRSVSVSSFEEVPVVPVSYACAVAQSACAHLRRAFATNLTAEVTPPCIPDPEDRRVILSDAHVVCAEDPSPIAYCVIRRRDAAALLANAFAEKERSQEAYSDVELRMLDRIAVELLAACGEQGSSRTYVRRAPKAVFSECAGYFEVHVQGGFRAAFGFGYLGDPRRTPGKPLGLSGVENVMLSLRVQVARGALTLRQLADLRLGSLLSLSSELQEQALLRSGQVPIAPGELGICRGRVAFRVGDPGFIAQ
jgi:flagellar motor switch/type III secretory pathway protein FliN